MGILKSHSKKVKKGVFIRKLRNTFVDWKLAWLHKGVFWCHNMDHQNPARTPLKLSALKNEINCIQAINISNFFYIRGERWNSKNEKKSEETDKVMYQTW